MTKKKSTATRFDSAPIDGLPPRRRAILGAAFEVLMEKGYATASTLEIATRAKVSKRELYAEFGSKTGILEALISSTAARMEIPLGTADLGDAAAFATALTRYGTVVLAELTHPAVIAMNRLAIAEAGASSELGHILDRQGREPNRVALSSLFGRAQKTGFVNDSDPEQMAGAFFSILFGDLMMRLLLGVAAPPKPREIEQRAERATRAVLRLFALSNG